MANVNTVQEVVMVHSPEGDGEKVEGEITVPITAVRVWKKTGWKIKEAESEQLVQEVQEGKASPAKRSTRQPSPQAQTVPQPEPAATPAPEA